MGNSAADQYKILFVDDEAQARKYFQKGYGRDFEVIAVADVAEAERVLETEADAIGVIVTDQRLPGECGVSLLQRVRERYPRIVRILTTAYSDIDSAIDAVNAGAIFRYVTKPWDIHELRGILLRAMETHQLQRERDALLREKVAAVQHLLLMDRLRGFMVLAAAMKERIDNALHGLQAFLGSASQQSLVSWPELQQLEGDVWTLAMEQNRALLDAVDEVFERVRPTRMELTDVPTLLGAAAEAGNGPALDVQPAEEAPRPVPELRVDVPLIRQALTATAEVLTGQPGPEADARVHVSVEPVEAVHRTAGARLVLDAGEPPAWDESIVGSQMRLRTVLEARLLAACLGVAHHRGRLMLTARQAWIELPADPARAELSPLSHDWMEQALTALEPVV